MTLEQQYRRLVRVFPASWRAQHEDELIGTLLDAAEPGRTSIEAREAADLVRCALLLRYRDARSTRLVQTAALALVSTLVVVTALCCSGCARSPSPSC